MAFPRLSRHSYRSIIIDTKIAQKYFQGASPIGRKIQLGVPDWGDEPFTVVGVVPSVKLDSLETHSRFDAVYVSASQFAKEQMELALNTSIPPRMLVKPLRNTLARAVPSVAANGIQTMRQRLSHTLRNQQTTITLLLAFAGIALALAVVGVYGVMSYAVSQRRAECGVRLALGAQPGDLSWMILKDGFKLPAIGLVLGIGLAIAFGYILSSQLFGVVPFDPLTLIGSAVVLCAITLAACYLPARHAAKIDPAIAIMEQ